MVNETERRVNIVQTYPFEVTVNNPEVVEVIHTRQDSTQLQVMVRNAKNRIRRKIMNGLTNCKRFTSGLDLVYSTTFPFSIQEETIWKE